MNRNAFAQANSFYANVPREPEGPDTTSMSLNSKAVQFSAIPNIATREPRRRFGYDGTDEYESASAQTSKISARFDPSAYGLKARQTKASSTDPRAFPDQGRARTSHSYVAHAHVAPLSTYLQDHNRQHG